MVRHYKDEMVAVDPDVKYSLKSDSWCRSQEKMFSEYKLKEIRCDMRVYDRVLIVRCFVNPAPGPRFTKHPKIKSDP